MKIYDNNGSSDVMMTMRERDRPHNKYNDAVNLNRKIAGGRVCAIRSLRMTETAIESIHTRHKGNHFKSAWDGKDYITIAFMLLLLLPPLRPYMGSFMPCSAIFLAPCHRCIIQNEHGNMYSRGWKWNLISCCCVSVNSMPVFFLGDTNCAGTTFILDRTYRSLYLCTVAYTLHTTVQERIHTSMPHKIRKAQADNGGAHAASIREMLGALLQQKSNSLGQDVPYRAYI